MTASSDQESARPAGPSQQPGRRPGRPRSGRRPGESGTRDAILVAARASFLANGYDGATMRGIATDAGVDPSLVYHFFGGKDALFVATLSIPLLPTEILDDLLAGGSRDDLGERLIRMALSLQDRMGKDAEGNDLPHPLVGILRSAFAHPDGARMVREFVSRELIGRVAQALDVSHPRLRANLAGSQLVGLVMSRYVIEVEPLSSTPNEVLVACYGPVIQHYLTGDLPGLD